MSINEGLIKGDVRQSWRLLEVDEVIVRERQRKVNPDHVRSVRESFESLGGQLQLQPIVVDENLVLIDGAHRLTAAKESGWTHISALVLEGVGDADRMLLEAEANRVRLQLTPLELEEVWKTIYEPAFKARAKKNQVAHLKQGHEKPVTVNYSNGDSAPSIELPAAAKDATGLSLDTINKITDIREVANSTSAPEELREAAQKGLSKLQRPGASVDAVHKSLLRMQERASRHQEDPAEAQRKALEKRLDDTLTETSLLAERLEGPVGADIAAAARLEQVAHESLRGVRIALTSALASVMSVECNLEQDLPAALHRIGSEVTRMLSEQSMKKLGLEVDHG